MTEKKKEMEETTDQAPIAQGEEAAPAAEEAAPEEEEPAATPNKKVRLMTLEEVEKKLARSRLKMGGDTSVYIKHLLARKAELQGDGEIKEDSQ